MRAEYINPFINSLTNTFRKMLHCDLKRGPIHLKENQALFHDISGVIGMSGRAVGTVVVSLSKEVALKAASVMLQSERTEFDANVIDAVGEITNMVAGSAKAELEEYRLLISLPSVVLGDGHEIRFPSNVKPICVPFESPWGALTLEVGLEQVAEPVAV